MLIFDLALYSANVLFSSYKTCGVWNQLTSVFMHDILWNFCDQECESEGANKMVAYLRELISTSKAGDKYGKFASHIW